MRFFYPALLIAFFVSCLFCPVQAREVVRSFVSDAELSKVGVMDVTEHIKVDVRGHRQKSLYRIIDTGVSHKGHRHNFDVKVVSVLDGKGHQVRFSQKRHSSGVVLGLDKSHAGRSGEMVFVIKYQVRGVANFKENRPQLVWEINGDNFPLPIEAARFNLTLPGGVAIGPGDVKAWNGKSEEKGQRFVEAKSGRVEVKAKKIMPGEAFKVEINFPIGTLSEPGFLEKFQWLASEWYLLVALPVVSMFLLGGIRFLKTRIPSAEVEEGEVWKAPENLRPVEVGTLIDQSCDVSDVSVTLINLAVRGYYTVREIPATGFFALSDRDYEFKKLPPPKGDQLKEYESIFLDAIFGNASTSYLSNIQGIFRQFLPGIRNSIYKSLVESKMLAKDPQRDKVIYGSVGFTLAALGVAVLFLMGETNFLKAAGLGLVVAGILVAAAPKFFPLRTEKGNKVIDQIHQFAETLRTAKERDLKAKLAEDKFLFHKLLPYAIILGVFEKWAAACEEYEDLSPDWFQFYVDGPREKFSASKFAKDVWIATKVAGLTFTAPPPRQYSSHTVGKFGARKEQDHEDRD